MNSRVVLVCSALLTAAKLHVIPSVAAPLTMTCILKPMGAGDPDFATRALSRTTTLARLILFAFAMSVHSLAAAYIAYWQFTPLRAGNTIVVTDLNDLGVISYAGFGDSFMGGASAVTLPPHDGAFIFFQGYGFGGDALAGVEVDDINDAGDALGSAIRLDGVRVPTIWIGGVPFDLTDPANAGLHFNVDPGPKFALDFDLSALPIVGLPFDELNPDVVVSSVALTNSRQDYIFHYELPGAAFGFYGLLTAVVPEPGTPFLVLAGMAATLLLARGRKHYLARWIGLPTPLGRRGRRRANARASSR